MGLILGPRRRHPRIQSGLLYPAAIGGVCALMLVSFVAIPARILGAKKQRAAAQAGHRTLGCRRSTERGQPFLGMSVSG
jgi:hypothetical protein